MDINLLLRSPEGKTLEFKQDFSSSQKVMRTVVAFANTAGGTIIIGIEDKSKHVCGVNDPYALEEKLANSINDIIAPQVLPEIEIVPWRDIYLVVIHVFPSSVKPHYIKQDGMEKGTYIRVGSTNRLADQLMRAELQRVKIEDSFDKQPIIVLSSEALDFRVASELFAEFKKMTSSDLESLDLVTNYQEKKVPTVGGMILFGKDRLKYFPDAWIQVGRFIGITKTKILDSQEIKEYPILAIDEAMKFIKKHAMHGIEIPGAMAAAAAAKAAASAAEAASASGEKLGKLVAETMKWAAEANAWAESKKIKTSAEEPLLRHKERWSMPVIAVREAIINAVVHADYSQQGAPTRLSIFDDRIEIENPGLLLFGLTIDDIKRGVSKLRNRVIGQVFYRFGLIERWGSGVKRIIDSCKEAGFAEPLFEEIGTHFRVTLFTQAVESPRMNETDKAIMSALNAADSAGLPTKEIAKQIGKSPRITRIRLITLIERGIVTEIGSGPNDPQRRYFSSKN